LGELDRQIVVKAEAVPVSVDWRTCWQQPAGELQPAR
jgi:hypothetical protein